MGDPIRTRTGYYKRLGNEDTIFDPSARRVIGYCRRFRFFHNNDGKDPTDTDYSAPIKSNWIVEVFRLSPYHYQKSINHPDNENRILSLALCKVKKDNVSRLPDSYAAGSKFEPSDSELLDWYLKKNILGLHIPWDLIPSFEVFSAPSPDDLPFADLFEDRTQVEGVWHFFCHSSYKHSSETGETKVGFYQPGGYKNIYGEANKLLGRSRILTYHEISNGESRESKWTIEEFKVDPSIVEVRPDDVFTKELVSDLAIYKVVNDEETREYPYED